MTEPLKSVLLFFITAASAGGGECVQYSIHVLAFLPPLSTTKSKWVLGRCNAASYCCSLHSEEEKLAHRIPVNCVLAYLPNLQIASLCAFISW